MADPVIYIRREVWFSEPPFPVTFDPKLMAQNNDALLDVLFTRRYILTSDTPTGWMPLTGLDERPFSCTWSRYREVLGEEIG